MPEFAGEQRGGFSMVCINVAARLFQGGEQDLQQIARLRSKSAFGKVKLMIIDPASAIRNYPELSAVLSITEERIPHHPGIYRAEVAGRQWIFGGCIRQCAPHPALIPPHPGFAAADSGH